MTVRRKNKLLTHHSFFNLKLIHAAIGSYPIHSEKNAMMVNRLLLIFNDSGRDDSYIRDRGSGERFLMRSGFFYFIPYGHEIDIVLTNELLFVSLQFNLDLYYGFDVFKNYRKCVMIENPALVNEARQFIEQEDDLKTLCRINEIIFGLCTFLLKSHPQHTAISNLSWNKYEPVLNYIRNSGDATTTVELLADMNGMRRDVFSRKFTRDMGMTPKDFIANTLMRKASAMLMIPELNVRNVAEKLKFSSEYYFSRFFKKHSGMAPSVFKKINGMK